MPNKLYSQCSSFPYNSTAAGKIDPSLGISGNNLICYKGCIDLEIKTKISVDSICVDFGDNKYLTIISSTLDTTIKHCYNFTPKDSCPASRPQDIKVEAKYYKGSPAATFSFSSISTTVSVQYLPRLPKVNCQDTVCVNDSLVLSLTGNSCTNGFVNNSATIIWNFGDGTSPYSVNDITNNYTLPIPRHAYTKPGIYYIKLTCSNTCGSVEDSIPIVVVKIDSVQCAKKTCTGDTIAARVYAKNIKYYDCYSLNGWVTIIGKNTSTPKIIFNSTGTFVIAFAICNPVTCIKYDTIIVGKGLT
ncbi:MAG: PKD domain-containing protein [Bacteroidota bacterium]|nr:PKD domain-containing protein [Bacteroidota bacterium]